jgi:plastocyanin
MFASFLPRLRPLWLALPLVLATAAPAACETITVTIEKLAYQPAEVTAKVGDTILWVNKDVLAHTSTARDKSFEVIEPPKKTVSQTLTKAGSFDYYCKYHPNMKGRLTVNP